MKKDTIFVTREEEQALKKAISGVWGNAFVMPALARQLYRSLIVTEGEKDDYAKRLRNTRRMAQERREAKR